MFSIADTMDKIENTSHLFGESWEQLLNINCVAEFLKYLYCSLKLILEIVETLMDSYEVFSG